MIMESGSWFRIRTPVHCRFSRSTAPPLQTVTSDGERRPGRTVPAPDRGGQPSPEIAHKIAGCPAVSGADRRIGRSAFRSAGSPSRIARRGSADDPDRPAAAFRGGWLTGGIARRGGGLLRRGPVDCSASPEHGGMLAARPGSPLPGPRRPVLAGASGGAGGALSVDPGHVRRDFCLIGFYAGGERLAALLTGRHVPRRDAGQRRDPRRQVDVCVVVVTVVTARPVTASGPPDRARSLCTTPAHEVQHQRRGTRLASE
jgi:hypothetical protein